ncbi:putative glycoside hydrolase-type carbohydrate-binding protein [Helianthus debilis subsp. tardiflorus]
MQYGATCLFANDFADLSCVSALGADKLTMIPRVRNVDNKAFTFTLALRNYFSVSDVRFAYSILLLSMFHSAYPKVGPSIIAARHYPTYQHFILGSFLILFIFLFS